MKHSQLKQLIKEEISKTLGENIELNPKSKQLYLQLKQLIRDIAEEEGIVDYTDFAAAVARVLEDIYGTHIYAPFMNELKKHLSR